MPPSAGQFHVNKNQISIERVVVPAAPSKKSKLMAMQSKNVHSGGRFRLHSCKQRNIRIRWIARYLTQGRSGRC